MPIYVEKNMRYMHFAEICEKCGNIQNMWQSHIRIKLTCLTNVLWSVCVCVGLCVWVLVTNVRCVNAAELIKMLFRIWTHLDQETCIRWGPGCPRRRVSFFGGGCSWYCYCCQCFGTFGWVSGRASWTMRCWCGYVWSEVQIDCIWSSWCHCIPKPHHLLPHLNPDWFYLSGTSLPRLSWERGR